MMSMSIIKDAVRKAVEMLHAQKEEIKLLREGQDYMKKEIRAIRDAVVRKYGKS